MPVHMSSRLDEKGFFKVKVGVCIYVKTYHYFGQHSNVPLHHQRAFSSQSEKQWVTIGRAILYHTIQLHISFIYIKKRMIVKKKKKKKTYFPPSLNSHTPQHLKMLPRYHQNMPPSQRHDIQKGQNRPR